MWFNNGYPNPYFYWYPGNIPPVYQPQPWVFPVDNTAALRAELNELRERVARLEKR